MVTTIDVKIDTRELDSLEHLKIKRAQDKALDKSLDHLADRARHYPPVRPSSTYIRTGNHRRSVTREKTSYRQGKVAWTDLYTEGNYAHWVRSAQLQARVHQNRWPTEKNIVDEAMQKIAGFYDYEISRID